MAERNLKSWYKSNPIYFTGWMRFSFDKESLFQSRENPHTQIQIFVKRESLQEHCDALHNLEMASCVFVNVGQLRL